MRLIALLLVAALAGCADTQDPGLPNGIDPTGSEPGPGFAPQEGLGEDVNGSLHLVVLFSECDAGYCLDATATNEGLTSYYVSDLCVPPHAERMERDGEAVYPREPRAYCAAFGVREWQAGEDITFSYTWDSMLWDDGSNAMVSAPEGAYHWTIDFRAYGQPDGNDPVTLSVTHTVVIGET